LFSYLELCSKCGKAIHVGSVMVQAESDPKHVAAHVGDAVPRLEIGDDRTGEDVEDGAIEEVENLGNEQEREHHARPRTVLHASVPSRASKRSTSSSS
jgi:hypothetical protein